MPSGNVEGLRKEKQSENAFPLSLPFRLMNRHFGVIRCIARQKSK